MPNEQSCPQCGATLAAGNPQGLCPACLLKRGLDATTAGYTAAAHSPSWQPPSVEELGPHFPELEIVELIGRGGMGAVYKAKQKNLDRLVALKILPPQIGRDEAFAQRFAREAQAMARLSHPHIVAIHDFGQRGEIYFFLMEYVDGLSLRQLLDRGTTGGERSRTIEPKEALAIVPQICEALQYAHDHGIVHRDIKPENILLNRAGEVKVADFGLAKLVGLGAASSRVAGVSLAGSTGVPPVSGMGVPPMRPAGVSPADTAAGERIVGTPQYMAPEQLHRPSEVDHRADIYSLGVVFYQMLTGELPAGQFEPPSHKVIIDVRLDEVVLRALEKLPERRYQQASEVKTEVETIVGTPQPHMRSLEQQPVPWDKRQAILHRSGPLATIAQVVRWTARIGGTLWLTRLAVLAIAGGVPTIPAPPNVRELAAAVALWIVGFVLGWTREGLAALLILLGWVALHTAAGSAWLNVSQEVPAVVGLLYALSWWLHRSPVRSPGAERPRGRTWLKASLMAGLIAWIACVVTVCALAVQPVYEAHAYVQVNPPVPGSFSGETTHVVSKEVRERHKRSQAAGILNDEVLIQAANKIRQTQWYEQHSQPGVNAVDELRRAVRVTVLPETSLIDISARASERGEVAFLANAVAKAAVDFTSRSPNAEKMAVVQRLEAERDRLARQAGAATGEIRIDLDNQIGMLDEKIRERRLVIPITGPLSLAAEATEPRLSLYAGLVRTLLIVVVILGTALIVGWAWRAVRKPISPSRPVVPTPPPGVDQRGAGNSAESLIERARQAVKGPAIGLLVAAGINLALVMALVAVIALRGNVAEHQVFDASGQRVVHSVVRAFAIIPVALAGIIVNGLILFGAVRMMRLRNRGLAIVGAILAMLAVPSSLLGLPMGIWALVVLSRREVSDAFAASSRKGAAPLTTGPTPGRPSWHRWVAVVGTRGGQPIINWPGVIVVVSMLFGLGFTSIAICRWIMGGELGTWSILLPTMLAAFSILPAIYLGVARKILADRLLGLDGPTWPRWAGALCSAQVAWVVAWMVFLVSQDRGDLRAAAQIGSALIGVIAVIIAVSGWLRSGCQRSKPLALVALVVAASQFFFALHMVGGKGVFNARTASSVQTATRPSSRPADAKPGPTVIVTCPLQATIYELHLPPDKAGQLKAEALASAGEKPEALEKALAELGKARMLYRVDQAVKLSGEHITITDNVPVVSDVRRTEDGVETRSVHYQSIGAVLDIAGTAIGDGIDARLDLDISAMTNDQARTASQPAAPVFRRVKMSHNGLAGTGKGFVILGLDAGAPDDEGRAVAYIARVVLGTPHVAAKPEAMIEGLACPLEATIYELHLPPEQAAAFDASALRSAASPASLDQTLAGLGQAKVLYRIDQSAKLSGDRIIINQNVPTTMSTRRTTTGQPLRTMRYNATGIVLNVSGVPQPGGSVLANLNLEMSALTGSAVNIAPRESSPMTSPVTRKVVMAFCGTAQPGAPMMMISVDAASPDAEGKAVAYIARIVLGKPVAATQPASQAVGSAGS